MTKTVISNRMKSLIDGELGFRPKTRWDKPDETGFVGSRMYYKSAISIKPAYKYFQKNRVNYYMSRNLGEVRDRYDISPSNLLLGMKFIDETLVYLAFNPENDNSWKTRVIKTKTNLKKDAVINASRNRYWKSEKRNIRLAVSFFYTIDREMGIYDEKTGTIVKWDKGSQEYFPIEKGFNVLSFRWQTSKINDKRVYEFLFKLLDIWLRVTWFQKSQWKTGMPVLLGFVIKRIDVGYKVPVNWNYFSQKQLDRLRGYGLFPSGYKKSESLFNLAKVL